jgi:hypothetical protein
MEQKIIEIALTELLEENKKTNQLNRDLIQSNKELTEKVASYERQLSEIKILPPPVDTAPIAAVCNQGIQKMTSIVEAQPKAVVRQIRILLFPEHNAREYYRTVFGRLIPWAIFIIALTAMLDLGRNYLTDWFTLHEQQLSNDQHQAAWKELEKMVGPQSKKIMQDAWDKALHDH